MSAALQARIRILWATCRSLISFLILVGSPLRRNARPDRTGWRGVLVLPPREELRDLAREIDEDYATDAV